MKEKIMFGIQFYPTPKKLASMMISKLGNKNKECLNVLDPSCGKGDLFEAFKEYLEMNRYRYKSDVRMFGIEIDPNLRLISQDKCEVIDTDFLAYDGQNQFDIILMNPPFANGAQHLLKALDIMWEGEIVCILNAETIRAPDTTGKKLKNVLEQLNADISFHKDMFIDAERTTEVEIALIHVVKTVNENTFFQIEYEETKDVELDLCSNTEVDFVGNIKSMVHDYEQRKQMGVKALYEFFQLKKKFGGKSANFLMLATEKSSNSLTENLKLAVNHFLNNLRDSYWSKILSVDAFTKYLTGTKERELRCFIAQNRNMEFNLKNIYAIVDFLKDTWNDTLESVILEVFDDLTRKHSYYPECNKNMHLYDGWKTNDAFKLNKKVIIPFYGDTVFCKIMNKYTCYHSGFERKFSDIEKVLTYFTTLENVVTFKQAVSKAIKDPRNVDPTFESSFFIIKLHKKGTVHITFKDLNAVRRLNVYVGRAKNWLPHDYGTKSYDDMTQEEKTVVDSFDGKETYQKNLGKQLILSKQTNKFLQIGND